MSGDSGFWEDVQIVFADALELDPSARASFLHARCGGRSALRVEVESLIAASEGPNGLVEFATAARAAQTEPAPDECGRSIGPFRLLEKIGEGGMGSVYCGERIDGEFTQRVAVKLVHAPVRNPDALRRFRSERQILATLNHPNIVTLLDGGVTGDGQAYLVMECVDGVPITAYSAGRRLSLEDRLRLFRDVCAAVHSAHQHGVVHRDLKPANILVTGEGMVKVLDFGIAKLLDSPPGAEHTITGALRPLTPNYASPEQLLGVVVTTASDIYAIGVLLYELVAGARPYDTSDKPLDEILDTVVARDPSRPSAARADDDGGIPYDRRRLKGDVDAIVLKAMSREPARRYGSAQELSEDITRHLAGRPILAAEPSFGYVARRLARRHRAAFGATAISVVALLAAFGVSLWQTRIAVRERHRAEVEAAKATQVSAFLRSLFGSNDPRQAKGQKLTAQDLLDIGAARIDKELADQPELQASMLVALGSAYAELSLYARAAPLLERSVALRERVLGKDHRDVAESLRALGRVKVGGFADFTASAELFERAVRIRERTLGPDHLLLAEVLSDLGNTFFFTGRYDEARAALQRAVAIEEKGGGPSLFKWLTNLANVEAAADDLDGARRSLERALEIGMRDNRGAGAHVDVTLLNFAALLAHQEDFSGARALLEKALAIVEQTYNPSHERVLYTWGELGDVYRATGDLDRAGQLLQRSISGMEQFLGPDHRTIAAPVSYHGHLLLAKDRPKEALLWFERALAVRQKALGDDRHSEIAENLVDIARCRALLEGSAVAEPILRRALSIQRAVLVAGHRRLVPTLASLGETLLARNEREEASMVLTEAVRIAQHKLAPRHSARLQAEAALHRLLGLPAAQRP